jgi:hypothetical protein
MAHDVFISHSAHDKPIADAVCAALEKAGIRCWVAPRDVQPGRSFAGEITRAIQHSKVMTLVFSEHSNTSEQILREVELAANSRLHIVQFRIDDVILNDDLKYYLSTPHWLDALNPPLESHLERLVTSIKTLLGKPVDSSPTSAATISPAPTEGIAPGSSPRAQGFPFDRKWLWIGSGVAALLVLGLIFGLTSRKPAPIVQKENATPARPESPAPAPAGHQTLLRVGTGYRIENNHLFAERYGFIGVEGHMRIEPQFENEHAFADGVACVKRNGKWGVIDQTGRMVVEPRWNDASESFEGLIPVDRNRKCGWIDATGRVVIEPRWDKTFRFEEGVARVSQGGKWGLIDKTGKVIAEPQWEMMNTFFEGLASVKRDGKFGFIDKTGKVVIEPQWEVAGIFAEGLAAVKIDSKFGFINRTGRVAIAPQYETAQSFSEGLAQVALNKKWGFIDKNGRMVIAPQFDNTQHFLGGAAAVMRDGKWGCIDRTGHLVVEPEWENLLSFIEGIAAVKRSGMIGFIGTNHRVMIEPAWEVMEVYREERHSGKQNLWLLLARQEGTRVTAAWFDADGKQIWSSR